MKISLYCIGKNGDNEFDETVGRFEKRLRHYVPFELVSISKPRIKGSQTPDRHREHEGEILLKRLDKIDFPVLLDEKGRQMPSEEFSQFIQQAMNRGIRHMGFMIGGAYGFSEQVYKAVPEKVSLSRMTFSHQLARLVFIEQLYRAMTLLKGEPYHHI